MEEVSIIIKQILPLIFAVLLIKYRRKYGIMAFLFLIINGYAEFPAWVHITFWALTSILACLEDDALETKMNHNLNYDVHDIQSEIKAKEILKTTLKKFDNIVK